MPDRVCKAVKLGKLRTDDLALLVMLLWSADADLEVVASMADLMTMCGWTGRSDRTSRCLQKLRAAGLIYYESKQGQQRPYCIRITGGARVRSTESAVEASARASAESPPSRAEAGFRSAEVVVPANPHGSGAQPPQGFRNAEVEAVQEVEVEVEVRTSTETDDLEELLGQVDRAAVTRGLDPLGPGQRANVRVAWGESPDGVRAVVAEALPFENPVAVLITRLGKGQHRQQGSGGSSGGAAAEMNAQTLTRRLSTWIRNEGRNYEWPTCEDEIQRRGGTERVQITLEQRQLLFEQWKEQHVPPEVQHADEQWGHARRLEPIERARLYVREAVSWGGRDWEAIWPHLQRQLETVEVDVTVDLEQMLFEEEFLDAQHEKEGF